MRRASAFPRRNLLQQRHPKRPIRVQSLCYATETVDALLARIPRNYIRRSMVKQTMQITRAPLLAPPSTHNQCLELSLGDLGQLHATLTKLD